MAGAINSLGIGSGVLTADVIDKLKANDKALTVTPIENKITLANQKSEALDLLDSLLSTFKTSVNSLDDDTLYQKRSVSGNNDSISVTADTGVAVQSFSISDVTLAKKHVLQSGAFSSSTSKVSSGSGTMTLSIGGKDFDIDYTSSTTLEDLKTAINNKAGEKVQASILQVGTNDYRLITTSKETGSDATISITDDGTLNYSIYKTKDVLESSGFTSATSLVASGAVAQSTKFSLSQALTDEDLSVTINGDSYVIPFNTSHAQTLADFKSTLEATNLFDVTVNGNDITLSASTAGVPYTINTAFQTSNDIAIGSTTSLTSLQAQSERFELDQELTDGSLSVTIDGSTYTANFDTDHATTVANFKSTLETAGFTVGVNGNEITLTSSTPGTGFTIDSPFSTDDSIAQATTTHLTDNSLKSTEFSLDQALTSESLSIEIDGTSYSVPFDTDHATTLANFQSALEANGFTVAISGNTLTLSDDTDYSITSPFTVSDGSAVASTTAVTSNVTPSGTYNVTMNGTTYNIAYNKDTTLTQLKDLINTAVGSSVASIHQVGTSYKLQLQSTITGDDSTLAVSDTGGYLSTKLTTLSQNSTTAQTIQQASNASFKYDGITMSRGSNEITDIAVGMTIKLLKETDDANIEITQDIESVSSEMTTMVTAYNTLMSQLGKMTLVDTEAGTVGIFNGDSSITSIRRDITKMLTSIDSNGFSLAQFGIDLTQEGMMTFNSTAFTTKFKANPTAAELFFSGMISYDDNGNESSRNDGVFTNLSALSERYSGRNGIMTMLTDSQKEETKTLDANKKRTQALLDARYESMTARFIQYDAIISKLNNQFSSLNQQIQMAMNS